MGGGHAQAARTPEATQGDAAATGRAAQNTPTRHSGQTDRRQCATDTRVVYVSFSYLFLFFITLSKK